MDESHKSPNSGTKIDPSTDGGQLLKNDKNNRSSEDHATTSLNKSLDPNDDTKKVEKSTSNSEESISLSSSRPQRRSQRAIKRKKFDDEVVSTEPGVVSATAAAVTGTNIPVSNPLTPIQNSADTNSPMPETKSLEEGECISNQEELQESSNVDTKNSPQPI